MILAASLTACSTFSEDAELWTAAAKEREVAKIAPAVAEASPKTPNIPPYVAQCVRYGLALNRQKQAQAKSKKKGGEKKGKTEVAGRLLSADELVLAQVKTAEEQQKCARAVLDWYRTLQKARAAAEKAKTS